MSHFFFNVFRDSFIFSRNYFAANMINGIRSFKKIKYKMFSMSIAQFQKVGNSNNLKTMSTKSKNRTIEETKNSFWGKYNITFEDVPIKSETDKKEYMVITLENGLKALLISDVENLIDLTGETDSNDEVVAKKKTHASNIYSKGTKKNKKSDISEKLAACSLTVGVGSFSDPETIPGLAHFLEHMLFLGSKKFPKENDFLSYISKRGGFSNAFTDNEITSFYFSCPDRHLRKIMDRFANFFISPLMSKDSMDRERETLDSEFQQNLSLDSARIDQIFRNTASLNNPANRFSWGNLITLKENIGDDELHKSLTEFWENHYTANYMTVAVQARLPLDTLGLWIAESFGEIKSNNKPPITFPDVNPPFNMDLFHKMYTIMPVEDLDHLILTWAFPSIKHLFKSKPLTYIIFLIGHKGEGSLFSYLHKKMWIIDLSVCCRSTESNSIYSMLSIDFTLTEAGLENYERIITLVFSYFELLNQEGPSESIFREIQIIEDLQFRFQDEDEAADNVQELSGHMQIYPSKYYITGDKLLFKYEPDEITRILNLLNPNNVNIMILSKLAAQKVTLNKTERWFQTKYTAEYISNELINEWENCEMNSKLSLPKPNIYIPENFDIIPATEDMPLYPKTILNNDLIEVWHKPDSKFKLPYGYVVIYLISPTTLLQPQNSVMCDFLQWVLSYLTINESYPASSAGLDFSLSTGYFGLMLVVDGFDDKIALLLETVLKKMMSFVKSKSLNENLFEAIKDQMRKDYYNSTLDPSTLANEVFLSILCTHFWDSISRLEAIEAITVEKLQEFSVDFFEKLYIKTLIQGNISEENAINISNLIQQFIDYKPILTGTYPQLRTRVLPVGENIIRVQSFNTADPNCNVTNYYQYGQSLVFDKCIILMLMYIMEEPLFDTLRTKENLAYNANCQFKDTRGITGFTVTVISQANKFTVEHVENRITHFLNNFIKHIENMTEEDFNRNKESLKKLLLVEDPNLSQEFRRNWAEIMSDEYMFDRVKKYTKCIETLTPLDLIKALNKATGVKVNGKIDSSSIRKLSIQIDAELDEDKQKDSKQTKDYLSNIKHALLIKTPENKNADQKFIESIEEFKRTMYIYPYTRYLKK